MRWIWVAGLVGLIGCTVDRRPTYQWRTKPKPISELPETVKAPAGQLSVHVGAATDRVSPFYVVNRTSDAVQLSYQDGALPAVLEAKQPDGSFQAVSVWGWSTCGNSYRKSALPPGQFVQRGLRIPQTDVDATLRLRVMNKGVPASHLFEGAYSKEQAISARYQRAQLAKMPFETLAALVLGEKKLKVSPRILSGIQYRALQAMRDKHYKDPRMGDVMERMVRLPEGAVRSSTASKALRTICTPRHGNRGQVLLNEMAKNQDFPRRKGVFRAIYGACGVNDALVVILQSPDDPLFEFAFKRLRSKLKNRYKPDLTHAFETLVDTPAMPRKYREQAKKLLASHGRDTIRLQTGLGSNYYSVELDMRTERPIRLCKPRPEPSKRSKYRTKRTQDCADFGVWNADKWLARGVGSTERHVWGNGPIKVRLDDIALPTDRPPGVYCLEAIPMAEADGLKMPTYRKTLRLKSRRDRRGRERRRWTFEKGPCPHPKPAD